MADLINSSNANDAWLRALKLVKESPESRQVASRNGATTELLHVTVTLSDPRQRWVFARQPAISPAFALAEAIWIVGGRNDSEALNFFNRDLPKFSGTGSTYYGAYGYRLRYQHEFDQLEAAYKALASNSDSRQVVLQIWDPKTDHPLDTGAPRSADIPCNTQSILRVQDGRLYWLQIMRSNDIFRGLPYNLVQFTTLQEIMAGWLGLNLGSYTHVVSSLHFYNHDLKALESATQCAAVENRDDLRLPKDKSDAALKTLDSLLTRISSAEADLASLEKELNDARMPSIYTSIGKTLLAEAARRTKKYELAKQLILRIQNPCLESLTERWFLRNSVRK
jgi:thymidylate synthase